MKYSIFPHESVVAEIGRVFSEKGYNVNTDCNIGGMARADLLVYKGNEPKYAIEVKVGPSNHYLPYSAYAQAQRMFSAMPTVQPIICTTMMVSNNLKALFAEAHMPAVSIGAGKGIQESLHTLPQEMTTLGIRVPEEFKE